MESVLKYAVSTPYNKCTSTFTAKSSNKISLNIPCSYSTTKHDQPAIGLSPFADNN